MIIKTALIVLMLPIFAGCASSGVVRRTGDAPGLDVAVQSAGPPVQKITYSSEYAAWRPLAADQLVIWENERVGYLVRVGQPCQGLQSASEISLTQRNGLVRTAIDSVKFSGGKCLIAEIRNVHFQTPQR
jgi:hypothetical protein